MRGSLLLKEGGREGRPSQPEGIAQAGFPRLRLLRAVEDLRKFSTAGTGA